MVSRRAGSSGLRECQLHTIRRIDECPNLARTAAAHDLARSVPHSTAGWKIGCSCRWPNISKDLAYSAYLLKHPAARNAYLLQKPPQLAALRPISMATCGSGPAWPRPRPPEGGQNVEVNAGGTHYMISLSYTSNTLATNVAEGTNGQSGTTSTTDLRGAGLAGIRELPAADRRRSGLRDAGRQSRDHRRRLDPEHRADDQPAGTAAKKGYAKSFAYGQANRGHLLNIGQITVNSGQIGDIEGFQDAELSGPLVASGTTAIDRIAFDAILPGASITTGGDVNTLDVLNGITLTGTSINIGRDLNLLNVGGNIDLSNGSQFNIGRNLGLVSQPPKGTGTGTNVLTLNFTSRRQLDRDGDHSRRRQLTSRATSRSTRRARSISGSPLQGNIINTMYVEGTTTAGFTPATPPITFSSTTQGTLSRLTINGLPASLLANAAQPVRQFHEHQRQVLCDGARWIRLSNVTSIRLDRTTTRHAPGIAGGVPGFIRLISQRVTSARDPLGQVHERRLEVDLVFLEEGQLDSLVR